MRNKSQIAYNKIAKNYDQSFDGKLTRKFRNRLTQQIVIDDEAVVLDVACGNGRFLEDMFKTVRGANPANFYGVDISGNMIKQAKKLNPKFNFKRANIENLPFYDDKFDVITMSCSLHHIANPQEFFDEVMRLLKPDGMFVVTDLRLPPVAREVCNLYLPLSPRGDYKFYSIKEVICFLEGAGFSFSNGDIDAEQFPFGYQIAAFK